MPLTLLPASAAAFAPRSAPTIVLNTRVEPWLTQALKRVNRTKRPLNNVTQHHRCLIDVLSGATALWSLASLMVPKAPDALLRRDPNPLTEALACYHFIHVEAYVVHVDMVSQDDVAFKLTVDTIETLIKYHRNVYSVDVAASTWEWSEKEQQLKKLQDDFVQAVNKYVFRTDVKALEGLEDEGAGELLEGRSQEVKNGILALFLPLLPPPPKVVEVVASPLFSGSPIGGQWYQPFPMSALPKSNSQSWPNVAPAQPYSDGLTSAWSQSSGYETHLPSPPTPSYAQPFNLASPLYSLASSTPPRSAIPLPSAIAQQCSTSATSGYAAFPWLNTDSMTQHAIHT